jgi:hypothetical protein
MRDLIRIFIAFAALTASAAAADFNAYVYWVPYNTLKTVEWQAVTGASGYEIYIWQMEGAKRFLSGMKVTESKLTVNWKTHGHYIVYVRCFKNGVYGEWANSLDPAVGTVDGKQQAWVLYVLQP